MLTCKRFLAGVQKHVILQILGVTARISALFTFKGLFSIMHELVLLEITSRSRRKGTLLTPEKLLS